MSKLDIQIKRAYDAPTSDDGYRVLVDRLWPRGVKKENLPYDLWLKTITPSPELRQWFHADPQHWQGFKTRYRAELDQNSQDVAMLREKANVERVTLLYASKETEHNHAIVLRDYLLGE